jgi:hypothetical protein
MNSEQLAKVILDAGREHPGLVWLTYDVETDSMLPVTNIAIDGHYAHMENLDRDEIPEGLVAE